MLIIIINDNITNFPNVLSRLYLLYLRKPICFTIMFGSFSFSFSLGPPHPAKINHKEGVCVSAITDDKDYLTLKGASMKDKDDNSKPFFVPHKSPFHVVSKCKQPLLNTP